MNENLNENDQDGCETRALDISDPGNWEKIDQNLIDILVERCPIRINDNDVNFPHDECGRHFSS